MVQSARKMLDWESELLRLEQLVVTGQHEDCRNYLSGITPKSIPRPLIARWADLATRVQCTIDALKYLHPYVFPENSFAEPASDKEKMIYSSALLKLGAADEAYALLETIDESGSPEVLFHKSMACFSQWNYAKSIPMLKRYIQSDAIEPYWKLVGEVNLAAAYINQGAWALARPLLEKIQLRCRRGNFNLLLGNSLELQAQIFFFAGNYSEALSSLDLSEQLLQNQKGIFQFFVEKWKTLCRAFESQNSALITPLRAKAVADNYWETIRECDLFTAILDKNEALLRKVIMGTPSSQYRTRACQLFGRTIKLQGQYLFRLGTGSADNPRSFDPIQATEQGGVLTDKPHLLALWEALTLDIYKPSYLGALFKSVYPEEKFNPTTSPPRVMQLLTRLDQWFKSQGLPLRVHFKKSEFSLASDFPIEIVIRRGKPISAMEARWYEIRQKLGDRTFSTSVVAQSLMVSKSSAIRLIKEGLKSGRILPIGRGAGTAYRFTSKSERGDSDSK